MPGYILNAGGESRYQVWVILKARPSLGLLRSIGTAGVLDLVPLILASYYGLAELFVLVGLVLVTRRSDHVLLQTGSHPGITRDQVARWESSRRVPSAADQHQSE